MPSPVLGIDLGTTNSVVAHADEARVRVLRDRDGHLLTPSTVSFLASGEVKVGRSARDLRIVDAPHTVFSVKRLMGRPFRSPEVRRAAERLPFKLEEGPTGAVHVRMREDSYSLPEISAFILRHLRDSAERSLGQPCHNAVITVPANFNELQRMATRDAGRIAGINVLRILNEPTAAALAYGYRAQQPQRVAVYDFGGGTFDISILELSGEVIEVVATAGDTHLGGDDIDRAIAERMLAQFAQEHGGQLQGKAQPYERLVLAAEWIKCQLSELGAAEATIKHLALQAGAKIDFKFQLSRSEFHELCRPLVQRTFKICEDALRLAKVRPSQLDAVLLVGGQTRTPLVREMVREHFGMDPKFSVDPDLAVAHGAALQGFALSAAADAADKRPSKSSAGSGRPSLLAGTGGFEDEPTRVAAPTEVASAQRNSVKSDRPHEQGGAPASAQDPRKTVAWRGPSKRGPMQMPSLKPERTVGAHAHTLTGVGTASSQPPASTEAVTVTSELPTDVEAYLPSPVPPRRPADSARERGPLGSSSSQRRPPNAASQRRPSDAALRIETSRAEVPKWAPSAAGARPPSEASEFISTRPRVETSPLPTLSMPPGAATDAEPLSEPPALDAPGVPLSVRSRVAASTAPLPVPATPAPPPAAADAEPKPELVPTTPPWAAESAQSAPPDDAASGDIHATLLESPRAKLRNSLAPSAPARESLRPPQRSSPRPPPPPPRRAGRPNTLLLPDAETQARSDQTGTQRAEQPALSLRVEPTGTQRLPETVPPRRSDRAESLRLPQPGKTPSSLAPANDLLPTRDSDPAGLDVLIAPAKPSSLPPMAAAKQGASMFPAPAGAAPVLLDVTPHTLSVETVGGFCEQIIERNAPIPTEQTQLFTTSRDNQTTVSVRVCQGESRRTDDNQVLGQIELLQLRQARQGEVNIAVTFAIDVDGTLNVRAYDEATGNGQELRVQLTGAIGKDELERMRAKQRVLAS